ncbi:MAG TPA: PAS domain S-box protein [Blastocatellia bacterium]|nr:PAS domain S-box protein [Blastocatellia bacterium]
MGTETIADEPSAVSSSWLLTELRRLDQSAVLGSSRELDESLAHLVRTMAQALNTDLNSILLVDDEAGCLVRGASVGLPDAYIDALKRVPIGPDGGCCGNAAFTGEVVVIEDMRSDPRWAQYLTTSELAGLRAVWSVPIRSHRGKVLGTYATYYRQPYAPSQEEIELARAYAQQAAIALESARLYDAAQRDQANLQAILEQLPEGVLIARAPDGVPILINRAGSEMLGRPPAGLALDEYERYWILEHLGGRRVPLSERPMARALAGEVLQNQEYRLIRAGGPARFHSINAGPLRRADGTIFAGAVIFADITERTEAEEALKHAIEWQESIIEGARDATFISDSESRLIAVNSAACELTGYSKDELLTMRIPDLHEEVDLAAYRQYQGRILAGEDIVSEAKILRKDGTKVDAEFNNRRMEVSGTVYMNTVARDVSERRRADAALRASEERFSKAFSASPQPMAITTLKDGRYVAVNGAFVAASGYTRDELVGQTSAELSALVHPEIREHTIRMLQEQGRVRDLEIEFRTKSGQVRSVLFSAELITLDGEPCMIGSGNDITERKRAEEALRESESRLKLALEASETGIWDWDMARASVTWSGQVDQTNASPESSSTLAEVMDRVHPDDRDLVEERLRQALTSGGIYDYEWRLQLPDGSVRWVAAKGQAYFDDSGKPERMIGVFSDITARKRAEMVQAATYKISAAANSAETLQALCRSIHGTVGDLMPADNFYIALSDPETDTLSFPYFVDQHRRNIEPRKLRKGLTEYVLRTGSPLRATPQVLEQLIDSGEAELIGASPVDWLGIPLRVREKSIGVLAVQSYMEGVVFKDEDQEMLVFVSTQIATAIERRRAEEALRESRMRLELLNGISRGITSGMQVEEVIERALRQISGYFPAYRVSYSTVDTEGCLRVTQSIDPGGVPGPSGGTGDLNTAPDYLKSLQEGKTVVVGDLSPNEGLASLCGAFPSSTTRAIIDVPLHHSTGLIGLLSFDSSEPRKWTANEIAVLTEVADYLSVGIKEARAEADKRLSEERLRESEERYRRLVELSPIAIGVHGGGKILYANPAFTELLGASSLEELLDKSVADIVHPDSWDLATKRLRRLEEERQGTPVEEFKLVRLDGQVIDVELTSIPITYQGEPAVQTVARDVTERRRAEEALRQSEDRYRDLVEHTQDLMCTHDLDGRLLSVNQGAAKLFGIRSADVEGRNLREIVAPEFGHEVDEYLNKIRRDGVAEGLTAFVTPSGERRILAYHNTLRTEGVAAPVVRGVAHDITDRKRAQDALRVSEKKYRDVFQTAPVGIYQSLSDGSILTANSALAEMLGYESADDLLRVNLASDVYLSAEQRDELIRKYEPIGSAGDLELQWKRKDGTQIWVNLNAHAVKNGEGKTLYFEGFVRDIDARTRAQDALRESEARFSKAFQASPDSISITTPEGWIIDVNQSFLDVLGYLRDEVVGRTAAELGIWVDPEDRARMIKELLDNGAIRDFEAEFRKKSGEVLVGLMSAEVIDVAGERCVLAVTRDITEQKRAEQERDKLLASERAARNRAEHANRLSAELLLREQVSRSEAEAARREWQTTFDTMTDAVVIVGADDRLIRANSAFYRMVDAAPEECLGRALTELVHPPGDELATADNCPICELRKRGERGVIELQEGVVSAYPIFASVDPVVNEAGEKIAFVQVVRNLSELYRAREEAQRERTSLNAIVEQIAEGMLLCDDKAAMVHANRRAQQIFGFPLDQMRQYRELSLATGRFTDEDGNPVELDDMPIHTALRERRPVGERRLWYSRPDGASVLLSFTSSPFFTEGDQLAGAVAFVRDITEQQRQHERAQQADKLRALGQLASGVAHNFNNALAAVLGYTELALPKVRDADVERYLRVVERSAKDAARMVERIQNFSRARSRIDEFTQLNVFEIVNDAIDITRPRWRSDAEALSIKYDVNLLWNADKELTVNGEPSELRELFVNVILNALDAMQAGGRLDIAASAFEKEIQLRFTDTGTGMSDDIKQRVFDPFFTTKGVAGLGMGLSEGYRIVERHGGRIDVESQVGRGTTFTVLLPVTQPVRLEDRDQRTFLPAAKSRVLVIDDEQFVREVLEAMLTSRGHEVVVAPGAEEALASFEGCTFDLVFTDLAMPKTDGIAAATAIKSRHPDVKIVLMSGYGAERAIERAAGTNSIDAAISKPFKLSEIDDVLSRLLARR